MTPQLSPKCILMHRDGSLEEETQASRACDQLLTMNGSCQRTLWLKAKIFWKKEYQTACSTYAYCRPGNLIVFCKNFSNSFDPDRAFRVQFLAQWNSYETVNVEVKVKPRAPGLNACCVIYNITCMFWVEFKYRPPVCSCRSNFNWLGRKYR